MPGFDCGLCRLRRDNGSFLPGLGVSHVLVTPVWWLAGLSYDLVGPFSFQKQTFCIPAKKFQCDLLLVRAGSTGRSHRLESPAAGAKWCGEHFVHQKSLKKVREVSAPQSRILRIHVHGRHLVPECVCHGVPLLNSAIPLFRGVVNFIEYVHVRVQMNWCSFELATCAYTLSCEMIVLVHESGRVRRRRFLQHPSAQNPRPQWGAWNGF